MKWLITIALIVAAFLAFRALAGRGQARVDAIRRQAKNATRRHIPELRECARCGDHVTAPCADPKCPMA